MSLRTFIFICYRREDSSGQTGRLYDHLTERFGEDQVFMDIDRIEPGQDFVKVLENAVGSCRVMLVIIGRDWLTMTDAEGRRRLDAPEDFVRVEVSTALARDITVIPVLVQNARMPRSTDLPASIERLARRQTLELSDLRWREDVARLVRVLEKHHEEFRRELESRLHVITSPFAGTFYRAAGPTSEPFVNVGYRVRPDTTVGVIRAMEMITEVYAEVSGTIRNLYSEDGREVDYGQPLFGVEKD